MRECKYCHVKMSDNDINCPLCGAHSEVVDLSNNLTPGCYPEKINKLSKKPLVRKIFISILMFVLAGFLVVSMLTKNAAFFCIALAAVVYVWVGILRFVFNPYPTRDIIAGVFTTIIVYVNAICCHFYFNGVNGIENTINALNVSVGIITPILLAIVNVVYLLIVLIGGNWYRYAYASIRLSIIEIAMFFITWGFDFTPIASIVCGAFGVLTILMSFIFGRNVMFAEFKKRFHV